MLVLKELQETVKKEQTEPMDQPRIKTCCKITIHEFKYVFFLNKSLKRK